MLARLLPASAWLTAYITPPAPLLLPYGYLYARKKSLGSAKGNKEFGAEALLIP